MTFFIRKEEYKCIYRIKHVFDDVLVGVSDLGGFIGGSSFFFSGSTFLFSFSVLDFSSFFSTAFGTGRFRIIERSEMDNSVSPLSLLLEIRPSISRICCEGRGFGGRGLTKCRLWDEQTSKQSGSLSSFLYFSSVISPRLTDRLL